MTNSGFLILALLWTSLSVVSCRESRQEPARDAASEVLVHPVPVDSVVQDAAEEAEPPIEAVEPPDSTVQAFVETLEAGGPLQAFFADRWTFVYHADNRCEGSTDGELDSLEPARIDSVIRLGVFKNGEGWECKQKPESFELVFDLKESVKTWDRFEREVSSEPQTDSVWVKGGGESDYLKLVFGKMGKIVRMEYRSEDPG